MHLSLLTATHFLTLAFYVSNAICQQTFFEIYAGSLLRVIAGELFARPIEQNTDEIQSRQDFI